MRIPLFLALFPLLGLATSAADRAPNIILIVSDDAGYADFSMHGSAEMVTPHIDSIAAEGIRFRQAYVSASVCSPSRAGFLTGRYQQRFGHEQNIPSRFNDKNGLPTSERLVSTYLQGLGYRTIGLGKWHLGYSERFHPLSRGFDDFFGFLKGSRSYFPLRETNPLNQLLRDRDVVPEEFEYITDLLGDEAVTYIDAHADKPFFLYLSFSAVHTPLDAKPALIDEVGEGVIGQRRVLSAMTASLDEAVGKVLKALERHGLVDDTLVVFLNDNGGAINNASSNGALRGKKGTPYEGGIRVPLVMRWPGGLPKGMVYGNPVSALDLLPTLLAASGGTVEFENPLDGVNLLPFLRDEKEGRPHEVLYWRRRGNKAVRRGDMKLVSYDEGAWQLFDLARDENEKMDLAPEQPDLVEELEELYGSWDKELVDSLWGFKGSNKRKGLNRDW